MSGGNSGRIELADFAYAQYALKKASVPQMNLVAIVDPSVEYTINTLTNLVTVQNNPKWEGIVADGIGSGMRFVKNVYGFDVYTSNFLPVGA
jgi:ribose 5-phosphate isomerase RpiB